MHPVSVDVLFNCGIWVRVSVRKAWKDTAGCCLGNAVSVQKAVDPCPERGTSKRNTPLSGSYFPFSGLFSWNTDVLLYFTVKHDPL